MAGEAERQKALALLFGEEVQEALKFTNHTIVHEAFALGDPAAIKNYAATMQQLAQAREWLARAAYELAVARGRNETTEGIRAFLAQHKE